jgi:hypothetical protein
MPGAVVLYFSHRANAAQDQEIQMSYANSHRFSIGGFAIACSLAVAAHTASQLADAVVPATLVAL